MTIQQVYEAVLSIWRQPSLLTYSSWIGVAIRFSPNINQIKRLASSGLAQWPAEVAADPTFVFFVEQGPNVLVRKALRLVKTAGFEYEVRSIGRWTTIGGDNLRAGSSVFAKFQNGNGSCGSAGALLKNSSDDSRWLLTANHVISRNRTPQRVLLDVPGPHELELGTEIRQVKVEAENNRVDAAVVKLTLDTAKFDGFFSPFGSTFGANLSAVDPAQYIGLIKNTPRRVSKVGMATVETHGVAKYVDAVVSIEMVEVGFEAAGFTDLLIVEDLDEIAVFAGGGDSGSLVVDDEPGNRRPVGILVARATKAPLSLVAFLKTTLSELEKTGTGPFELCRS